MKLLMAYHQNLKLSVSHGTYKVVGEDSWGDGWNNAVLTGTDTSNNVLFSFTFEEGFTDSMYFSSAPTYGCTDWRAENYDPEAMIDDSSCTYAIVQKTTVMQFIKMVLW